MINSYNEKWIEIAASGLPRARNLKRALVNGAGIDYQSQQNGYTALMCVVSVQHDRIAEYLLSLGANPLLKNNNNQTVVTFLLDRGANPFIKNYYGETPGDIALRYSPIYLLIKNYELLTASFFK